MGLDMYLTKRVYVKNWDHMKPSEKHKITIEKGGKDAGIPVDKISEIVLEMGYWRKANHIHKWFVDNVQDGQDDCREYYLTDDDLKQLLSICEEVLAASVLVDGKVCDGYTYKDGKEEMILVDGKVIKDSNTASRLLPTTEGFFFGSTYYDEYYLDDVKSTIKIIKNALSDGVNGDYYYKSSW
jgi:hypothetical protein